MPIVKMPDGTLVNMPDNPSPELVARLRTFLDKTSGKQPPPTVGQTVLHTVEREAAPMAGGIAAGTAAAGALLPITGPMAATGYGAIPAALLEFGAFGLGALGGSSYIAKKQEEFLKNHPELAKSLGIDEETTARELDEKTGHPTAANLTSLGMNLLAGRPTTAGVKAIAGYGEQAAAEAAKRGVSLTAEQAVKAARIGAAGRAGMFGGLDIGQQLVGDQPLDLTQALESAALGAISEKETGIGRTIAKPGKFVGSLAAKGVEKVVPEKFRPVERVLSAEEAAGGMPKQEVEEPKAETPAGEEPTAEEADTEIAEAIKKSAEETPPTPATKDLTGVLGAEEQEAPVAEAKKEAPAEAKAETPAETPTEDPALAEARAYVDQVKLFASSGGKEGEPLSPFKIRKIAKSIGISSTPKDPPGDVFQKVNEAVSKPAEAPKAAEESKAEEETKAEGEPPAGEEETKAEGEPPAGEEEGVYELQDFVPSGVSEKDIAEQTGVAAKEEPEAPAAEPEVMRKPVEEPSKDLESALMTGNLNNVLDHLRSDPKLSETNRDLYQSLATLLREGPKEDGRAEPIEYNKVKLNVEGTSGHDADAIADLKKRGKLAEYDPKTNTIHVTKEGMSDEVVLHESLHAATVRTLKEFETTAGKESPTRKNLQEKFDVAAKDAEQARAKANEAKAKLDAMNAELDALSNKATAKRRKVTDAEIGKLQEDRDAHKAATDALIEEAMSAENVASRKNNDLIAHDDRMAAAKHINDLMKIASTKVNLRLKYSEAFRNVYEFVSYGMTNRAFQEDLAKVRIKEPVYTYDKMQYRSGKEGGVYSLWTEFTKAIARIFRLQRAPGDMEKEAVVDKLQKKIAETEEKMSDLAAEHFNTTDDAVREDLQDRIEQYEANLKEDKAKLDAAQRELNKTGGARKAEGNFLLELSQAVSDIIQAPKKVKGVGRLAAVEPGGEPKKVEKELTEAQKEKAKKRQEARNRPIPEIVQRRADINRAKVENLGLMRTLKNSMTSKFGIDNKITLRSLIKNFQNSATFIKDKQDAMSMAGKIKVGVNNAYDALILKRFRPAEHTDPISNMMKDATNMVARVLGKDWAGAVAQLDTWAIARAEGPLRKYFYDLNVPLDNVKKIFKIGKEYLTAADYRKKIVESIPYASTEEAALLRKKLSAVVEKYKSNAVDASSPKPEVSRAQNTIDIDHPVYDVAGEYSSAKYKEIRENLAEAMRNPELAPHIQKYFDGLRTAHDKTIELLRESGHWGPHVDAAVAFQGRGDTYVPLKGADKDGLNYIRQAGITGETEGVVEAAGGRRSEANSPYAETMAGLDQALNRANRAEFINRIYNLIKDGDIPGKILKPIQVNERSSDYVKKLSPGLRSKIELRYNRDGTIDVMRIDNREWADAIRNINQTAGPEFGLLGKVTRGMATRYTRVNPFFGPGNFARDLKTNFSLIFADYGPKAAAEFAIRTAVGVARGSWWKSARAAHLASKGPEGIAKLEKLAEKSSIYKSLYEYYKQGGFQLFKQMYSTTGELAELGKEFNGKSFVRTREMADHVFDVWNDAFELMTRGAAYKTIKDAELSKGLTEAQAQEVAAARAKRLLNLEESGKYGKTLGAYKVLYKAGATGGVRSLEAFLPIFQSAESALKSAESLGGKPFTPEEKAQFIKSHNRKRFNASLAAMVHMGMGAYSYYRAKASAPEDDRGRNIVETDDKRMWVNNLRIPAQAIFGDDYEKYLGKGNTFINVPWGYGGGAFAAMGAQIAALADGDVDPEDFAANIVKAALDSFLPIPIAGVDMINTHPIGWAIASIGPSALAPIVEFGFNADEFGRDIYNSRLSKYGDAYTGGEYTPEVWKDVSRFFQDELGIQSKVLTPGALQFFASNYLGGVNTLISGAYNKYLWAMGEKDYDVRDLNLLRGFVGRSNSYDARQFADVEEKVTKMSQRLNAFEASGNEEAYNRFLAQNPKAPAAIKYYNQIKNKLGTINAKINRVSIMNLPAKEKAEILQDLKKERDLYMGNFAQAYKEEME